MALVTATNDNKSLIAALGPMKMEVVEITAVTDLDTYNSKLANPTFGFMFANEDAGAVSVNSSVVTTADSRVVTLHNPPAGAASATILVLFGF